MKKAEINKKIDILLNDILCLKAAEHLTREDMKYIADRENEFDTLSMYYAKAEFVEKLCEFYITTVNGGLTIERMEYDREENGNEWVYVYFDAYSAKRFTVNYDNADGIFKEFGKFLLNYEEYAWIQL